MPKLALSKFPVEVLQAELQLRARRANKKLCKLLRQRAKLDAQIAELEAIAGVTPKARRGRKPGRKPGPKPKRGRRGSYAQTGEQFVLSVIGSNGATSTEIRKAWGKARNGRADNTLTKLFNDKMIKRARLPGGNVSMYTLTGAGASAAKPKTGRKRGSFAQTGDKFILDMVKGAGATTTEINKKWTAAGRGGKADNVLGRLVKAGKLTRAKLPDGRGSMYTLA